MRERSSLIALSIDSSRDTRLSRLKDSSGPQFPLPGRRNGLGSRVEDGPQLLVEPDRHLVALRLRFEKMQQADRVAA